MFYLKGLKFKRSSTGISAYSTKGQSGLDATGLSFIVPFIQTLSDIQLEAMNKCSSLMGCFGQKDLNPKVRELKYLTGIEHKSGEDKTNTNIYVIHANANAEVSAIKDANSRINLKRGSIVVTEVTNPSDTVSLLPELIPKLHFLSKRDFFLKQGWEIVSETDNILRMKRTVS